MLNNQGNCKFSRVFNRPVNKLSCFEFKKLSFVGICWALFRLVVILMTENLC